MSRLTIDCLKAETGVIDDKLNQRCFEKHLKEIVPFVKNFNKFATIFKLPDDILSGIDNDPNLELVQKTEAVFLWWRENIRNATYRSFVESSIELSEDDTARKMCELCARGKSLLMFIACYM